MHLIQPGEKVAAGGSVPAGFVTVRRRVRSGAVGASRLVRRAAGTAVMMGALATVDAADAAETGSSARERISRQLRTEYRYAPAPAGGAPGAAAEEPEPAVELPAFVVKEPKDRTGEVVRFFAEERQRAMERRPSLERGAALHGERTIMGPHPYRDLFKDDARFKTDRLITPTWNVLDVKF